MIYITLIVQKKNVQVFVDPRSTKFRRNFKVIDEQINTIKKVDPNFGLSESI